MDKIIVQPEDYKYYVAKPDPSFSPQRNQAIIRETITETEAYFAGLGKTFDADMQNRFDIFSTYAVYRFNKGTKNIKQYLGDRLSKELIGEKILSKVRVLEAADKLGQNTRKFIQV